MSTATTSAQMIDRPATATVLIVDDEDTTRTLCQDVVSDAGLRTRTASTTEQALEILDQSPVDIVITDLRVPHIGGRFRHHDDSRPLVGGEVPRLPRFVIALVGPSENLTGERDP